MRFRRIAILFPGLLAGALCGASPTVLDLTTAAGAVKVEGNISSCPRNGRLELTVDWSEAADKVVELQKVEE